MGSRPEGALVTERLLLESRDLAIHDSRVEAPTVLAIHGFGSDGRSSFGAIAPPLADAGLRVVAPDLPGFGLSKRPSPELGSSPYSLSFFAEQIAEAIDAAELESCVVAGHSMGAKIAIRLALDFPGKVKRLVLINPAGFSGRERLLPLVGHLGIWYRLLESAGGRLFGRAVGLGAFLSSNRIVDQVRDFRNAHRAMDLRHSGTLARVGELQLPTLLLWGADDPLLPRTVPDRVTRLIPQTAVHYIGNAGHAPMIDQPEVIAAAIKTFVTLRDS